MKKAGQRLTTRSEQRQDRRRTDTLAFSRAAGGEGAGEERLAGTGRTVKEDASRRGNVEPLEYLGVEEWQRDHLLELLDVRLEAADLVEGYSRGRQQRIGIGEVCAEVSNILS
jgi:hypothetical protein